jgi:hypothetical protein
MNRWFTAIAFALGLGFMLFGCTGDATTEVPSASDLEHMPLALAQPFFQAGYELVGYYEPDSGNDSVVATLAVLTLRLPMTESFLGDSYVLLFSQRGGGWSLAGNQRLDGVNASAELRDLTGDDFPELLVLTEEADPQLGEYVTPLHYTDHLSVFTYTPEPYLVELGTFSSSLSGVMRPRSTVGEWGGQPAIQTVHDLPPTGGPLLWPYRVETYAWDGQGFAGVQVQEQRRVPPIVSWLVHRNAPWAAAFLALGGVLSAGLIAVARRTRLRERWVVLGLVLLLIAGGIGLGLAEEWLCVPALILVGLSGLGVGRQVAAWLFAANRSEEEIETKIRTGIETGMEAETGDAE